MLSLLTHFVLFVYLFIFAPLFGLFSLFLSDDAVERKAWEDKYRKEFQ